MKKETVYKALEICRSIDTNEHHIERLEKVIDDCKKNIKEKSSQILFIQMPFEGKLGGTSFDNFDLSQYNKTTIRLCQSEIKRLKKETVLLGLKLEKIK